MGKPPAEIVSPPTVGEQLLELYSGLQKGVYHFENYIIFNLPALTLDLLDTNGLWSYVPEAAWDNIHFKTAQTFGDHYVTFREELEMRFDRVFEQIKEECRFPLLTRWLAKHPELVRSPDTRMNALIGLAATPERINRLRIINANDFRKHVLGLLNRTCIRAPLEQRVARKSLLTQQRTQEISLSKLTQDVCKCPEKTLVTARRNSFYVDTNMPLPFTPEQKAYFKPRIRVTAPHINVGDVSFVSLDYLQACHSIGLRSYPELAWIKVLCDGIGDGLAALDIYTTDDWKREYNERVYEASKTAITTNNRHTTFTKEMDTKLWGMWKRYMHEEARTNVLAAFPDVNARHLILRGRLMSQIRRKNKPIEFLWNTEGLKKFLGDQFPTYSAVID